MSVSPIDVASNFKLNINKLIDYLLSITESDADLLLVRIVVRNINDIKAIERFAANAESHREEIVNKNENYFLNEDCENANIFSQIAEQIGDKKVLKFKNIWKNLNSEQKECIWSYFQHFVKLSDRYKQLLGK